MRRKRRVPRVASQATGAATLWAAGGCAALLLSGIAQAADDDPRYWLARTDQALSKLNYEGVFVHEHGGDTETLRVIHRVGSDGVSERLLSMDGSGREFIRRGTQLTCYLPDKRVVLVEKSSDSGLLLASLPRLEAGAAGQYQITELTRTRASGRPVRVIAITPMDELRYGYRVWVDEASAMPLKTQLRSRSGEVLEQLVFTDLRLQRHISERELQPAVDTRGFTFVHQDNDSTDTSPLSVSWQAAMLPPGFTMTTSARQVLPGGPVEHLVFTDGMASVSVFVEVGRDPGTAQRDDAARLGTSSAYSTTVQGYRVTAVGEVPPDTVRAIALSIRTATNLPSPVYTYEAIELPLALALRSMDTGSIFDQTPASAQPEGSFEHRGMLNMPRSNPVGAPASAFGASPPMTAFGPSSNPVPPRH
ncbi:MAG TPA: MucB/RseB C-terminal domain-containing protein [Steroidobacteraceae bacterium]|jgi:sigma-E factor negative regulatory protein RseB|nr:MucB/RseB C-terminal domain-containing protein [Steroidobacteraceae bacterium]